MRIRGTRRTTIAAVVGLSMVSALAGPALADSSVLGDGYTAPAPTKADRGGTDQDEYCIPESFPATGGLFGNYLVDGQWTDQGCYSTHGAPSVTITTNPDAGSWTFDYSADLGAAEASDAFAVTIGTCLSNPVGDINRATRRAATVSLTNTADASGRYIRALGVASLTGGREVDTFADKPYVTRLEDGQTTSIDMFEWENDHVNDGSGLWGGTTWTIRVGRSDLQDTIWDDGAHPYTVFSKTMFVPDCRMTHVSRGYDKTRVTVTAHDYWGAAKDRRFRIRLFNKRGRTVYSQAVPMLTGQTKTVVLKKSAMPKRILAHGIPEMVVEQWDPAAEYVNVGSGKPASHWGEDYGGWGYHIRAWRTR